MYTGVCLPTNLLIFHIIYFPQARWLLHARAVYKILYQTNPSDGALQQQASDFMISIGLVWDGIKVSREDVLWIMLLSLALSIIVGSRGCAVLLASLTAIIVVTTSV
jgi:hypothetical protein